MLAAIRRPDGGEIDLTLTTNGSALRALAGPLAAAGLQRVTVSLDSLDDAVFGAMNGIDFPVAKVLDGIDAAIEAGLAPVKVNMVVRRGINESSLLPMAAWARETGVILRCIEYMDVGHSNGWRLDEVVPAAEIVETIAAAWPVEPAEPAYRGEVAGRWRYTDGGGEFGVISSVTQPFCRDCTRARISAEGMLYTCLFAVDGHDLRAMLRSGASDEELHDAIETIWLRRGDRYSETPLGGDVEPAADRDVRDGRLTGRPLRRSHRVLHRLVHSGEQVVDGRRSRSAEFVDNRVDRPRRRHPNVGLARRGRQDRGTRDHIKGRFAPPPVASGASLPRQVAVSPRSPGRPEPDGT